MNRGAHLLSHLGLDPSTPGRRPRILLLAAHPDDETLGAGGQLKRWSQPTIVHVTDGAPRDPSFARAAGFATPEEYAAARRRELAAALEFAGVSAARRFALGHIDQEVSRDMAGLARELLECFGEVAPEVVLTHAYEGGHPDHDAVAFAAAAAVLLSRRVGRPPPLLVEMALYHRKDGALATHRFLPCAGAAPLSVELDAAVQALKRRMLACFVSQREVLAPFAVTVERFRVAPSYEFGAPPHPAPLHYETLGWGFTGERWRSFAAAAAQELDLAVRCGESGAGRRSEARWG